jgi:uncharacterized protein YlxW (UPF0749 family)
MGIIDSELDRERKRVASLEDETEAMQHDIERMQAREVELATELAKAREKSARLAQALERTLYHLKLLLSRNPVWGATETIAEAEAALAGQVGGEE